MIVTLLSVVLLGVCSFLIFLVLSQDVKGGGLAGALGGGAVQSAFGGRSAESITRLTAWVTMVFFVLVIAIGLFGKSIVGITGDEARPNQPASPTSPGE
jgi:protein translocase SecG subunit